MQPVDQATCNQVKACADEVGEVGNTQTVPCLRHVRPAHVCSTVHPGTVQGLAHASCMLAQPTPLCAPQEAAYLFFQALKRDIQRSSRHAAYDDPDDALPEACILGRPRALAQLPSKQDSYCRARHAHMPPAVPL